MAGASNLQQNVFRAEKHLRKIKTITEDLLPVKSRSQYKKEYKAFGKWRENKRTTRKSSSRILQKSKRLKSSSLWAHYSMLKRTIYVKENVDISRYILQSVFFVKKKIYI